MAEEGTETTETTGVTETAETVEATKTVEAVEAAKETKVAETTQTATVADWRASIPEGKLRDHAGRFTSPTHMSENSLELRQQLSTAIQPLPTNPTDEQVTTYRERIGVPKTAEDYAFDTPEGHELTDTDKDFRSAMSALFHGQNISVDQAKGLEAGYGEFAAKLAQAQIDGDKKFADETSEALKVEWPGAEFERNKAFADAAVAEGFGDNVEEVRHLELKDGRFVLDHPIFLRMLAKFGREMDEGKMGGVMTEGDRGGVENQIDDLQTQIEKAQARGDGSKANKLYQEQQGLWRKITGAGPVVGAEGRTV